MIEAYAFLAMFLVQILAMSVLHPAWFTKQVRVRATRYPAERFAQFYPGVDLDLARERFLARYRALNTGIAVLGLLLLGWLLGYMRRPDWNEDPVVILLCVYGVVQLLPICFVAWSGARFKSKVLKHSLPEAKRKATLQRRGLFDFVSPFAFFVAVSGYFLYGAFVIYAQQKPFKGFALLGVLTLVYALQAFVVYRTLYGKKINPIETNADSVRAMRLAVKSCVYGCILCVLFFATIFTLDLLDRRSWLPFATSACLVVSMVICFTSFAASPPSPYKSAE